MRMTVVWLASLWSGIAVAAPLDSASQDSLDKRLFLLRRAAERGDCGQAVEAAELIQKDFGDVPGARVGRAYALACTGKWTEAWVALAAARASGADVRDVEALVRDNLAFAEVRVLVDGAPSDKPEFAPAILIDGAPVQLRQVKGAVYALEGMPAIKVNVIAHLGGADYAAAPVMLDLVTGKTIKADFVWKANPYGSLELSITVDGRPMSAADAAAFPAPEVTTADGGRVKLDADGAGRWTAARAPAGPLRIRIPESASNEETIGAVTVETRGRATSTIDLKRQSMALLTRPSGLDPSIVLSVAGKELGTASTRVRTTTVEVTARWTGGEVAPVTWSDDLADGIGLPWVHVVRDERGDVLTAALHAPTEREVDLEGVPVNIPRSRGRASRGASTDARKNGIPLKLSGTLRADPGRVTVGVVDTTRHPAVRRVRAAAAARRAGIALAAGGAAVIAGGSVVGAIGYAAGNEAATQARNTTLSDGQSAYEGWVAEAEAGAAQANQGIGIAGGGVALVAGGVGWAVLAGLPGRTEDVPLVVEAR